MIRKPMGRWLGVLGLAVAGVALAEEDAEPVNLISAPPLMVSWARPVYPPPAVSQQLEGQVRVRFVVDETGAVKQARALESSSAVFEEAAVQAVKQWRFVPGGARGKPEAKCLDVTLSFQLAAWQRAVRPDRIPPEIRQTMRLAPFSAAAKMTGDDPDYPAALLPLRLSGAVRAELTVDADGRVTAARILAATHSGFVGAALAAVGRWQFAPATQGDLAIASPVGASLLFTYVGAGGGPVDVLAANELTVARTEDGKALDRQPRILVAVDPVYPYDLLLAGTPGEAVADVAVKADGTVRSVTILSATQPEFGRALAAALECWVFTPAQRQGLKVPILITKRHRFILPREGAGPSSLARLVAQIRAGDTAGLAAEKLDAPPRPLFQVAPRYPEELRAPLPAGRAEIEFVIDADGRGQLARIASASDERFGWAAATAVERWVFAPPKRGGQPAPVRWKLPFDFKPPE